MKRKNCGWGTWRGQGLSRGCTLLALVAGLPAAAAPITFEIEASHTYPRFSYDHLGLSTQMARFNKTTGRVTLDSVAHTGSVELTIDLRSVDTGSIELDRRMQGPGLLDTARHPFASFRSRAIHFRGDAPTLIDGVLTINGIARPVSFAVTHFRRGFHPVFRRDAIGGNATATITPGDFRAGRQAPLTADQVVLDIALEAIAP